jgi:hypothetical protein
MAALATLAAASIPPKPTYRRAPLLFVTEAQAREYFGWFVNRKAYVRQSHKPGDRSAKYYYYRVFDKDTKEPIGLDVETIRKHLAGNLTVGLYSINPVYQSTKWFAIDADYTAAEADLRRLKAEFAKDGITALFENSRRGGHLWMFAEKPILAKTLRLYVLSHAKRLGIAVKKGKEAGIEVFPRQDTIEGEEFGNAIRGPLGVHRATCTRYWFEGTPANLEAQFELLRSVDRISREQMDALTAELPPIVEPAPERPLYVPAVFAQGKKCFQILEHLAGRYKRQGKNYIAQCPSCAQSGKDHRQRHLSISVAEPLKYRCFAGCTSDQIRASLGVFPAPSRRF